MGDSDMKQRTGQDAPPAPSGPAYDPASVPPGGTLPPAAPGPAGGGDVHMDKPFKLGGEG